MKELLLRIEPVIWLLFGQGILLGTMLMTGWILVIGLLIPVGIVPAEALSWERAYGLAASLIGRVVLFGLLMLPLWKGAHHLRSLSVDLRGGDYDAAVGGALYLLASVGTILALLAVARL